MLGSVQPHPKGCKARDRVITAGGQRVAIPAPENAPAPRRVHSDSLSVWHRPWFRRLLDSTFIVHPSLSVGVFRQVLNREDMSATARRRTKLVEGKGVEVFELRATLWFDDNGRPWTSL